MCVCVCVSTYMHFSCKQGVADKNIHLPFPHIVIVVVNSNSLKISEFYVFS